MSYNVVDDFGNQLVKVGKQILWEYKYTHGNSSRKNAPVSKTVICLAEDLINESFADSKNISLLDALDRIVTEAVSRPVPGGLLVSQCSIDKLVEALGQNYG